MNDLFTKGGGKPAAGGYTAADIEVREEIGRAHV